MNEHIPALGVVGVDNGTPIANFALSLIYALQQGGISVSVCLTESNFNLAVLIARLTGRPVHFFDSTQRDADHLQLQKYLAERGAQLVLWLSTAGWYEAAGQARQMRDIFKSLDLPVVMLCPVYSTGAALKPYLQGCLNSEEGLQLAGLIPVSRTEAEWEAIEALRTNWQADGELSESVWGTALVRGENLPQGIDQVEPHLALPFNFYDQLLTDFERSFTVAKFMQAARGGNQWSIESSSVPHFERRARIAVSSDVCFNLNYQDNIALLKYYGADIKNISPLADAGLPKNCSAVYLTGGHLHEYAQDLTDNRDFLESLREYALAGGIVFSEGSGTALLFEHFEIGDQSYRGAGIIPGVARFDVQANAGGLRMIRVESVEASILGESGLEVSMLAGDYWTVSGGPKIMRTLVERVGGKTIRQDGYSPGAQLLHTFGFLQFASNPSCAKALVDAAEVAKKI